MKEADQLLNAAKGIIFDCDGTLVDSMPLHMQAWKHAFKKHNSEYDESFLHALKGMKETEIIAEYNSAYGTGLDPAAIVSDKHIFFNENISEIKPIEKIAGIAKKYFGQKPMAVVSGSTAAIVHKELKIIGISSLFDTIITASDPFKPKPDPECFLEAASRLQINPNDILVFEDGDTGLESARKAGMKTVDVRCLGL
jgi:beta-phosphoglucomutase-like phosphatase (HAD superfamily)